LAKICFCGGYWVLERISYLFPACRYLIASRNPIFFKNRISPFEPKVLRDLCVPTKPKIPLAPAQNIPQFVLLDID